MYIIYGINTTVKRPEHIVCYGEVVNNRPVSKPMLKAFSEGGQPKRQHENSTTTNKVQS